MDTHFTQGESSTSSTFFYDVFLSFSGIDIRKTFLGHLDHRLRQHGFQIFKDDKSLRKGDVISPALEKGIENSRISIVVLSTNYASSRWCLDELVKILECKDKLKQRVVPIFYDVEPTEVRKQTGKFGDGLAKLKERFGDQSMEKWKVALNEVANLSGSELRILANGCESEFIGIIIQDVKKEVSQTPLDVATHPVRVDSRAKVIELILQNGQREDEVRMVGIHGVGGIGKTTLAKEMYNRLCQHVNFDGSCFLSNVRSEDEKNGLHNLQEKLLNILLKTEDVKVNNVDDGITKIRRRLRSKKVLLVLDDVDHIDQLNSLARERNWFGSGSLVVITTRNKRVLHRFGEKDLRYEAELLNKDEAMLLFCKHAFDNPSPPQDYVNLAQDIIKYAGGLPLALVTLGSHLHGRSIEEWKSEFKKLKAILHSDIQNILKISFDRLDGDTQRVFLDIACAFHGLPEDEVTKILNACDFHTEREVATLVQKHLLQREEIILYPGKNQLCLVMHDLVRDMGREIVRKESLPHPGKRSRLFNPKEVRDVLQGNKGTKKVEVLMCHTYRTREVLSTEVFQKMKNLRVLIIDGLCVSGDFGLFPKQLKWLSWQDCPLERIPSNFPAANLIFLDMRGSAIKEFDLNLQFCPMLKELDLSNCWELRKTPKFNGAQSLEILLLERCLSLTEIDQSICQLKSLQVLDISECYEIQTLPVDLGDVQSLRSLCAFDTGIKQLPESVEKLKNLETLELGLWHGRSNFPQRRKFSSKKKILSTSLSRLALINCGLRFLKDLRLSNCENLQTLPSVSNLENLTTLKLRKLVDITGLDNLPSIERINMINCTSLQNPINEGFFNASTLSIPSRKHPHKNPVNEGFFNAPALSIPSRKHPHKRELKIYLQCNEIPGWCSNQVTAPSICLTVPRHDKEYKFLGMVLWFVCHSRVSTGSFVVSVSHRERESMQWADDIYLPYNHGELSCVYYISYLNRPFDGQMIKGGEKITVHREDDIDQEDDRFYHTDIKKIGIHLLYLDQHGNVTSLPGEVDHSYSKFPEECSAGHKRAKLI